MSTARSIDVQDVINAHPVSGFQKLVIALCFLVVAIDGFDTAAVGFIAPALRKEWGVTPAQLAPLFGAGLFGLMVGAFVFGPLTLDRVHRPAPPEAEQEAVRTGCLEPAPLHLAHPAVGSSASRDLPGGRSA